MRSLLYGNILYYINRMLSRHICNTIIIFFALTAWTYSAETPSPHQNKATATQKPSPDGQSKTGQPEAIKIQPATKESPDADHSQADRDNRKSNKGWDWPAILQAIGSLGLLGFAFWQMGFIHRTTEATENAANAARENAIAAKDAAEAANKGLREIERQAEAAAENVKATMLLANLERPWVAVYPDRDPMNWPFSLHSAAPFPVEVRWEEINYGRSPAFVDKISASLRIFDLPLPETRPKYNEPDDDIGPLFLAPNGEKPHDSRFVKIINKDDLLAILTGAKAIVLFGYLEYEDTIEKKRHTSRFCFKWFFDEGRPTYSPVGPIDWIEYT